MIWIGTSGYSFKDWVGPFYPAGTRSDEMLEYYARSFPSVEINATYYRLPRPESFAAMARRTPPGFRFMVKLHREVTHEQTRNAEAFTQFLRVIEPLEDAGKYHGALAQFPWAFRNNACNRDYLRRLREHYPVLPLFVEFRHDSWARPETNALLSEIAAGYCSVDEPDLPGLFPRVAELVGDVGYFRFHGRNAKDWWGGDNAGRYNYLYSDDELKEWVEKIREIGQRSRETFVFFNNCHAGRAVQNARRMAEMLALPGL